MGLFALPGILEQGGGGLSFGYCPLDTTGMYEITYVITLTTGTIDGYCPLETTGLYDFDTPP